MDVVRLMTTNNILWIFGEHEECPMRTAVCHALGHAAALFIYISDKTLEFYYLFVFDNITFRTYLP